MNYSTITGGQTVAASIGGVGPNPYGNLTVTGASGIKTAAAAITVGGNLTIATAGESFADGGFQITVNGNISNSGAHTGTGVGELYLFGGSASHSLTGTGSYANIELNDANGVSEGASFTIGGVLTQTSGLWNIGAGNTLTVNGTLAATGSGAFAGAAALTSNLSIGGTGALGNTLRFDQTGTNPNLGLLTLNRTSSGAVSLGTNLTLNAVNPGLTLTAGLLNIGSNKLTYASTSTTTGGTPSVTAMIVADGLIRTGQVM